MLASVGKLERAMAKSFHECHHKDDTADLLSHHPEMEAADSLPVFNWAIGVIGRESIMGSRSCGGKRATAAEEWKMHFCEAWLTTMRVELHGIVMNWFVALMERTR